MTELEHKVTDSFTIDHAKQTLEEICSNIDKALNNPENNFDFSTNRVLGGVHRYLSSAINQINEAKEYFNT